MTQKSLPKVGDIAKKLIDNTFLLSHEDYPFSYHFQKGDGRVMIMAGDNSTGKSLLSGMITYSAYKNHDVEPMVVSMARRTQEGIFRAMTYGDEREQSTGQMSASVSLKALNNLPSRLDEYGAGMVVLDEPDVGLSEGFSYAFGEKIAAMINGLPQDKDWNVLITSHSRQMIQGLVDHLAHKPSFVHTQEPKTLEAWLAEVPRRSVAELDDLLEGWVHQFRAVSRIMDEAETLSREQEADESTPSRPAPGRRRGKPSSP